MSVPQTQAEEGAAGGDLDLSASNGTMVSSCEGDGQGGGA